MKIGLFFGSFNPITVAHLGISDYILETVQEMDEIWFVVSPQNPFKKESELLNERDRYNMIKLSIKNNPKLKVSNVEFFLPKPSYTVDTLNELSDMYPNNEFVLIIGTDIISNFNKWKNYDEIISKYPIYVMNRGTTVNSEDMDKIRQISEKYIIGPSRYKNISSTMVRDRIKNSENYSSLVHTSVLEYIERKNLYK